MHRGRNAVVIVVAIVAAACSSGSAQPDEVGASCPVRPGVVCRGQDLRGVSLVAADLHGADFSGSDLRGSDLRNADLTDAKFVGSLLGDVNLTGSSLKNADLTRANLFFTNLTDADLSGVIRTGSYACNVTQPDGALAAGDCASATGVLLAPPGKQPTGPPSIDYFRLEPPGRCLNDAAGAGVDVQWSTRNATALTFFVDDIRIDEATKARGSKRLPFVCDGKPHAVVMQAFGALPPVAASTFTASLEATAPLAVGS